MEQTAILPLFYLPPISYMQAFLKEGNAVLLEMHEHFPKQTFRNRAAVLSPNGKLDLIVPVIKGSRLSGIQGHSKIKDVRVGNDTNWQRLHWRSLESCYRNSAYFEYYEDELLYFYSKQYDFLIDLNTDLFHWVLAKLKRDTTFKYTEQYETADAEYDYRNKFTKTSQDNLLKYKPYFQVFENRTGFIKDLSIVDLLFNQGPQAINYLVE